MQSLLHACMTECMRACKPQSRPVCMRGVVSAHGHYRIAHACLMPHAHLRIQPQLHQITWVIAPMACKTCEEALPPPPHTHTTTTLPLPIVWPLTCCPRKTLAPLTCALSDTQP